MTTISPPSPTIERTGLDLGAVTIHPNGNGTAVIAAAGGRTFVNDPVGLAYTLDTFRQVRDSGVAATLTVEGRPVTLEPSGNVVVSLAYGRNWTVTNVAAAVDAFLHAAQANH